MKKKFKCPKNDLEFPNLFLNRTHITKDELIIQAVKFISEFYEMRNEPIESMKHRMELLDTLISGIHYYHMLCIMFENNDDDESWNNVVDKINNRLKDDDYRWGVNFNDK